MKTVNKYVAAVLLIIISQIGNAAPIDDCGIDVSLIYIESTHKNRFEMLNNSKEGWIIKSATIDLATIQSEIFFDTQRNGGIEVLPPDAEQGDAETARVEGLFAPPTGGKQIQIDFSKFDKDDKINFVLNLQIIDELADEGAEEIPVTSAEIEGVSIYYKMEKKESLPLFLTAKFGEDGRSNLKTDTCSE